MIEDDSCMESLDGGAFFVYVLVLYDDELVSNA